MIYRIADSIGPFELFDQPLDDSVVTLVDSDENAVSLDEVASVAIDLFDPEGNRLTGLSTGPGLPVTNAVSATVVDDTIVIRWLAGASIFILSGLWTVRLKLNDKVTVRGHFVVEEHDGWQSLASARDGWVRCPVEDDAQLFELLLVAKHQCTEYAPELADGQPVPLHYRKAQLVQARNVWNAAIADASGEPSGEFDFRPRPLDWHVQQLLRPKRGVPVVG